MRLPLLSLLLIPALTFSTNAESGSSSKSGSGSSTDANVQSKARPFDLDIVDKVQVGGSDDASKAFMKQDLPVLTKLLSEKLGETTKVDDSSMALDPDKLFLKNPSDVRVYFVGEGAGNANSLGYNTEGGGVKTGDPLLIFPNASSQVSSYNQKEGSSVKRTQSEPLLPGDFVDLGSFKAGTKLDFFLIANGALGGNLGVLHRPIGQSRRHQSRDLVRRTQRILPPDWI